LFSPEKRRLWEDLIEAFQYLKGDYKQEGNQLFPSVDSDRAKGNGFKLKKGRFSLSVSVLHRESADVLEQAAQRGYGCSMPGDVQGQIGWSSEQPGLVGDVPAYDLNGSFQTKPFYDFMIQ